jgi:hypothetical protein
MKAQFFSYVLDSMLFAVRQLGAEGHDITGFETQDKAAVEDVTSIFGVQEPFVRSAKMHPGCRLKAIRWQTQEDGASRSHNYRT